LRLLDEMALAGPEHLDATYVAQYDRKAAFDPAEDLSLLQRHGLGAEATLVDVGAGTGAFALAAARVCTRVVAVDVSPAMVEATRARAAAEGLGNVECVHAGFLSYEHTGSTADFVYSRNALHHLPDFWKVLALHRLAGVLRAGGVLYLRDLVFSCEPGETEEVVAAWLDAAAEHSAAGWTRDELEAHLTTEHSTFSWLLEPMLERAGFQVRLATYRKNRAYADYLCTTRAS
jgi:ubiquinone/menaquinone biosynthesis C-methylase UbiE